MPKSHADQLRLPLLFSSRVPLSAARFSSLLFTFPGTTSPQSDANRLGMRQQALFSTLEGPVSHWNILFTTSSSLGGWTTKNIVRWCTWLTNRPTRLSWLSGQKRDPRTLLMAAFLCTSAIALASQPGRNDTYQPHIVALFALGTGILAAGSDIGVEEFVFGYLFCGCAAGVGASWLLHRVIPFLNIKPEPASKVIDEYREKFPC